MTGPRRVQRGERVKFSTRDHNALVEAARKANAQRFALERHHQPARPNATTVLVRNETGNALDRFSVLAIDGMLVELGETMGEPCVSGRKPTKDLRDFVVLQEPLAPGAIGPAVVIGVTAVKVYSEDGEKPAFADAPEDATGYLVGSRKGPARVIYREEGEGDQWALVALGSGSQSDLFPVALIRVAGTAGSASGSATYVYDVYELPLTEDSEPIATNVNLLLGIHPFVRPSVGLMTQGSYGIAYYDHNGTLLLVWVNEIPVQQVCST